MLESSAEVEITATESVVEERELEPRKVPIFIGLKKSLAGGFEYKDTIYIFMKRTKLKTANYDFFPFEFVAVYFELLGSLVGQ